MTTGPVTVFSKVATKRLVYVLDWIFKDVYGLHYILVHDEQEVSNLPFFIAYGQSFPQALSIPDCGLLFEQGIAERTIAAGIWNEIPVFFSEESDHFIIPFDLFSAVFFLLSRYEEYMVYTPDKHGRYPATESFLFQKGWLRRPLVDEWLYELAGLLAKNNIPVRKQDFSYQATYDIDIAYSYKHKSVDRIIGAAGKALLKGNLREVKQRLEVLLNRQRDPFDCFEWLQQLHRQYQIRPIYFMLAARKTTDFDKNNAPEDPAMQQLIKTLAQEGDTGIHPSYFSTNENTFNQEKALLEEITGKSIHWSRQHYLRLTLPETYERLLRLGIQKEFSMGYGSRLGFRAGTGRSFRWYNLIQEETTILQVYPFCFMDSTAHFEEQLNATQAFDVLNEMRTILDKTGSTLVTVFHNFSLGTDPQWNGWREAYAQWLQTQ